MTIEEIREFVVTPHVSDFTRGMEADQEKATAYAQYVGELVNLAEQAYSVRRAESLTELGEDETETLRKVKLEAWTSTEKRNLQDLKNLYRNLKSIRMTLAQAIKTRRTEPI